MTPFRGWDAGARSSRRYSSYARRRDVGRCFVAWVTSQTGVSAEVLAIVLRQAQGEGQDRAPVRFEDFEDEEGSPGSDPRRVGFRRAPASGGRPSQGGGNVQRDRRHSQAAAGCWRSRARSSPSTRWAVNARFRRPTILLLESLDLLTVCIHLFLDNARYHTRQARSALRLRVLSVQSRPRGFDSWGERCISAFCNRLSVSQQTRS
jgi:hypothetical protein